MPLANIENKVLGNIDINKAKINLFYLFVALV